MLENTLPQLGLKQRASIKIKLEVDTNPPLAFETEEKLLLKPFSFYVKCFTAPNLFAGKMHALLFRKWKNDAKGRDWFDMEWYIKKGVPVQLSHFLARAIESGDWQKGTISETEFRNLLLVKIENMDLGKIKADVIRFIPDAKALDIWSVAYFKDIISYLKIV